MTQRRKILIKFLLIILLALLAGLVSYPQAVKFVPPVYQKLQNLRLNLGLDLQGGIHLEYKVDTGQIEGDKVNDAIQAVQDVVERRVNAFGVAEPVIYTTKTGSERRLIVELAGVKDIVQAKEMIKETPFLEFKEEKTPDELKEDNKMFESINAQAKIKAQEILDKANPPAGGGENFEELAKQNSQDPGSKEKGGDLGFVSKGTFVPEFDKVLFEGNLKNGKIYPELVESQFGWHIIKFLESRGEGDNKEVHAEHILIGKQSAEMYEELRYKSTGLTGKNLKNAQMNYQGQGLSEPMVSIQFDDEGTKFFAEITKRNVGKKVAIYLDGVIVNAPVVNEEIPSGQAVISGNYTQEEAKLLARRLREGALPIPINLVSQQSIEASLGAESLQKSLKAGIIGLIAVIVFMILYYRFLGLIAALALLIYTGLMISIFKLSILSPWGVTLTLPGIAGFVLSIGMAVDANILIFERTKEEVRRGRNILSAIDEGFKRAWTSIRDGNVSSIITSVILAYMGTGFVKGFAVTLIIGVLVSMFTAVVISRTLIKFFVGEWVSDKLWLIGEKNKNIITSEIKK